MLVEISGERETTVWKKRRKKRRHLEKIRVDEKQDTRGGASLGEKPNLLQ
jgi:hypothetical protein